MNNMFEQPLYEYEPTPAQHQGSDLFHDYEVKGWLSSAGLFKVLGISAVANVVALLVFAQTSLLTMKGCDSPLVGSVCQVLDTVYVGSLLFGTDREFVDAAYDKIDLEDADITYIDVSKKTEPLTYPAGYFQVANPEQFLPYGDELAANDLFTQGTPGVSSGGFPENIPGINSPSFGGNSLFDTPPSLPKSNPDVIDEETLPGTSGKPSWVGKGQYKPWKRPKNLPLTTPSPEETIEGFPTPDEGTVAINHTPAVSPSPSATPTVAPTVEPTGPVDVNDINTRPFKDLAKEVNDLLDKKQLDLRAPLQVLATAKLSKDGKIIKDSFKVTSATSSDQQLVRVATFAVAAFNDSNMLSYLKDLSGKNLTFLVQQDQTTLAAAVRSEVETDSRAKAIASALNLIINVARQKKEDGIKKLEAENDPTKAVALQHLKDDYELLKNTQVTTNGKEFIVGFSATKEPIQQMIGRMLVEQKAQPQPTEATSGVPTKPADPAQK